MSHCETFGDHQAVADWVAELLDQGLTDAEVLRTLHSPEALIRLGHLVTAEDLLAVMRVILRFCTPVIADADGLRPVTGTFAIPRR